MTSLRLFLVACIVGGVGGFIGSVVGSAFGKEALFAGGFLGGVAVAPLSARIARWRRWIEPRQYWPTTAGAAVGFIVTATIAVNTLSSPVGPILAASLTGIGAIVGARSGPR